MICKSYHLTSEIINKNKLFLLYGKNEGHKNEIISSITEKSRNILNYDEKEILENSTQFLENLLNQSLFENEKFIIIKRCIDEFKSTA